MRDLHDHFADAGRRAAGISLSLLRVEQRRETQADRRDLTRLAGNIARLSLAEVGGYDADDPLFAEIDGLFIIVKTLQEFSELSKIENVRERASTIAGMLRAWHNNAGCLRRFFREAHDIAWEIVTIGLHVNPVIDVFNALALALADDQQLPSEITRALERREVR